MRATGKPWRVKGAPLRRRSEPSASPRLRPVVQATRAGRVGRVRNSRLTPPPAHCGEARDSLLPARTRGLGIPRERSRREKGLLCGREQTLLPSSLCLWNDGDPFGYCPEFYLYSLVHWPSPYRSAAELAHHSSNTLPPVLTLARAPYHCGVTPHSSACSLRPCMPAPAGFFPRVNHHWAPTSPHPQSQRPRSRHAGGSLAKPFFRICPSQTPSR